MATKVSFKITSAENFVNPGALLPENESDFYPSFKEGQIIFVEGENSGNIYIDFHGVRKCYSAFTSHSSSLNYLGISDTDPKLGGVTIDGDVVSNPNLNDMVVYGTKEYLYRKNKKGDSGWFEIGDEDVPSWET